MEASLVTISELLGYIFIGICLVIFVVVPFSQLIGLFIEHWRRKQRDVDDGE